ncbi:hypothetical protein CHS0354_004737 [Potamilus streckersoni]|uniref:Lipoma HMGIC fusion partner-like 3 protein n=1 Tax=Potamilus streckersoni TaxID=2493646 RepID=A0AAE0TD94_9BIVA|nr:hypothetical protein CHS0354_004737 [Potamilus streckersoni]
MNQETNWNAEVTKVYHTNYVRNSRAIAAVWAIFSMCYVILNVVAFVQPYWFGDTNESPGVGYFGLYEFCERTMTGAEYTCRGDFLDFSTILNNYFRGASFLVGISALLFIFSCICMLMFLFLRPNIVFNICGSLQVVAGVCIGVGCIIYPRGFDDVDVRRICGQNAVGYNMAHCEIKWGYILAIVLIFDAFILSILAFVLSTRQAKSLQNQGEKKVLRDSLTADWTGFQ